MYEDLLDLVVQVGLLAAYAGITTLLTVAGALVEYNGFVNLADGRYLMAAWLACGGGVILYFGLLTCRTKLLAQYSRLVGSLAGN